MNSSWERVSPREKVNLQQHRVRSPTNKTRSRRRSNNNSNGAGRRISREHHVQQQYYQPEYHPESESYSTSDNFPRPHQNRSHDSEGASSSYPSRRRATINNPQSFPTATESKNSIHPSKSAQSPARRHNAHLGGRDERAITIASEDSTWNSTWNTTATTTTGGNYRSSVSSTEADSGREDTFHYHGESHYPDHHPRRHSTRRGSPHIVLLDSSSTMTAPGDEHPANPNSHALSPHHIKYQAEPSGNYFSEQQNKKRTSPPRPMTHENGEDGDGGGGGDNGELSLLGMVVYASTTPSSSNNSHSTAEGDDLLIMTTSEQTSPGSDHEVLIQEQEVLAANLAVSVPTLRRGIDPLQAERKRKQNKPIARFHPVVNTICEELSSSGDNSTVSSKSEVMIQPTLQTAVEEEYYFYDNHEGDHCYKYHEDHFLHHQQNVPVMADPPSSDTVFEQRESGPSGGSSKSHQQKEEQSSMDGAGIVAPPDDDEEEEEDGLDPHAATVRERLLRERPSKDIVFAAGSVVMDPPTATSSALMENNEEGDDEEEGGEGGEEGEGGNGNTRETSSPCAVATIPRHPIVISKRKPSLLRPDAPAPISATYSGFGDVFSSGSSSDTQDDGGLSNEVDTAGSVDPNSGVVILEDFPRPTLASNDNEPGFKGFIRVNKAEQEHACEEEEKHFQGHEQEHLDDYGDPRPHPSMAAGEPGFTRNDYISTTGQEGAKHMREQNQELIVDRAYKGNLSRRDQGQNGGQIVEDTQSSSDHHQSEGQTGRQMRDNEAALQNLELSFIEKGSAANEGFVGETENSPADALPQRESDILNGQDPVGISQTCYLPSTQRYGTPVPESQVDLPPSQDYNPHQIPQLRGTPRSYRQGAVSRTRERQLTTQDLPTPCQDPPDIAPMDGLPYEHDAGAISQPRDRRLTPRSGQVDFPPPQDHVQMPQMKPLFSKAGQEENSDRQLASAEAGNPQPLTKKEQLRLEGWQQALSHDTMNESEETVLYEMVLRELERRRHGTEALSQEFQRTQAGREFLEKELLADVNGSGALRARVQGILAAAEAAQGSFSFMNESASVGPEENPWLDSPPISSSELYEDRSREEETTESDDSDFLSYDSSDSVDLNEFSFQSNSLVDDEGSSSAGEESSDECHRYRRRRKEQQLEENGLFMRCG